MPPSRVLSDKLPNSKPVVIFINLDKELKRAGDTVYHTVFIKSLEESNSSGGNAIEMLGIP